jgi:crotonobetainyl-CoA:carnitine CoA-transferase CaiB-like acyl-CoA transferase
MKPLLGIHVLCAAINVPGPVAAARLTGLGANITKIEPPTGDPLAAICPQWYAEVTQGMTIRTLDLKSPEGSAELETLLETSGLLLTASRPAALERLGLDWNSLHVRYPELCQVAIVSYGPPKEDNPGHDLTFVAGEGLLDPPDLPRSLAADLLGAEQAAAAALGLLLARERGQGAGYCRVALDATAHALAAPLRHGITSPEGVLGGALPFYNIYPAKEGFVALAALEPRFAATLLREWHPREVSYEEFSEIFLTRTAREWEDWAGERYLPLVALPG